MKNNKEKEDEQICVVGGSDLSVGWM